MRMRERTQEEIDSCHISYLRNKAYDEICPRLNRAERRTAHGRMLVAQAELAAAQAELEYLRELAGIKK